MLFLFLYYFISKTILVDGVIEIPSNISLQNNYKRIIFNVPYAKDNGFAVAQIHTLKNNSTFSYTIPPQYGESDYGRHHGLFKRIYPSTRKLILYDSLIDADLKQSAFAVYYAVNTPIPGACCQTCALEVDPNIQISYNMFTTTVRFYRASTFYTKSSIPSCDTSESPLTFRLQYKLYYYFLRQHDFTESSLFDALRKMSNANTIADVGNELETVYGSDSLMFSIETVVGYAMVFNVIVYDPVTGKSSAYVPSVSYGCNVSKPLEDECMKKGSTTTLVFCILLAVIGTVMAFAGLKLYPFVVFIAGFLTSWLIIFALMGKYVPNGRKNIDQIVIISACCSIVGGAAFLFFHAFQKFRYICFLVVSLCFGLFISAIVFYTPFGYYEIWNIDYRFILGLLSFTMGVSLVCLFFPRVAVYLFSTVVGSYGIILLPNYFMYGNMQYIIATVLLRMTVYDFGSSFLRRPYQKEKYILTGIWAALTVFCLLVQYIFTRKDEFEISGKKIRDKTWITFSQSFKKTKKSRRRRYKSYSSPAVPPLSETTPLLNNERQNNASEAPNANPTLSTFNRPQPQVTQVDVHNAFPSSVIPSAPPTYEESQSSVRVI